MSFKKLDLSDHQGKIFAVGDIHGCFTVLENKLTELSFNKNHDLLISVGDLVDRGPESHLAKDYVKQPWFTHILGNHEYLTSGAEGAGLHRTNGGQWFYEIKEEDRQSHIDALMDGPVILEILTPSGNKIGFVHGDYPTNDWNDIANFSNHDFYKCVWDRYRVALAKMDFIQKKNHDVNNSKKELKLIHSPIKNIDHVYFGHTPLKHPITVDNCTWIDTGCFATNIITVVEII